MSINQGVWLLCVENWLWVKSLHLGRSWEFKRCADTDCFSHPWYVYCGSLYIQSIYTSCADVWFMSELSLRLCILTGYLIIFVYGVFSYACGRAAGLTWFLGPLWWLCFQYIRFYSFESVSLMVMDNTCRGLLMHKTTGQTIMQIVMFFSLLIFQ